MALDPREAHEITEYLVADGTWSDVELVVGDPHEVQDDNPEHGSNTDEEMLDAVEE